MSSVSPGDSTVTYIRKRVRRLTASSGENVLSTAQIDEYINNFYSNDFVYSVKVDQMRSVYTFFTRPNIDRYPLDVNFNQGVRSPMYVEGVQGVFFKDREEFYNMWPRWPTYFSPIFGDGVTTVFTFTLPGPFLSKEVVIGGVDTAGTAISVNDDGNGNLQLQVPNPVVSVPAQYAVDSGGNPIPGMKNINTLNPGLLRVNTTTTPFSNAIGSVDYVTGVFNINFPVAPASGKKISVWVSQYQTGRPYSLLFWNNEFTIRPIPDKVHKVEIETYLSPVQFMLSSDLPILNQWSDYIALGSAIKVLEDRMDMEGIANLSTLFDRQEALVLERQGVEEIGMRNSTIFCGSSQSQGWNNNGWGGWY